MSDKKYRITLTEKQLGLIGKAVEIMLRTVLGDGINVLQKQLLSELRSEDGQGGKQQ